MAETNEFDAYWDNKLRQRDLEIGVTDGAKGVAGAAVKGVGSLVSNLSAGDIARGARGLVDPTMNKVEEGGVIDTALTWLNDTFDQDGSERRRISDRVKELQASGSLPNSDDQNNELTVAALPGLSALTEPLKGAEVVGDIADKAIKPAAKIIGEPIKEVGQGIIESTSPDMQEAMSNPEIFKDGKLGRGAGDPAAWAGVAAQAVGSLIPTVATAAITKNPTASLGVGMGMSVGQAGDSAYDTAINSNPMDLIDSPIFVGELKKVSQDPEFAELDGAAKVEEAQRRYAELSSSMAKSKPETMAAAAMGTLLGDATIVKTMLGSGAGGAVRGMLKGAATEAPGEFGEEWLQQYVGNTTQNQMANTQLVDPMAGTLDAGLHGAAGGVMAGGAMGGTAAKFAKVLHVNRDNLTQEQAIQIVESSMKKRGADDATARQVAERAANMMANPELSYADNPMTETAGQVVDQSPLGPSAGKFDEVRDVPSYLRRDGTADRFKGMAENSPVQEALAGSPAPTVDDLLSQAMSQPGEDIAATAISGQQSVAADNAVGQPTAATDTAGESVADDAAQAQPQEQNAAPSALDAVVGQLQTLRITRKGKPFASEKEAAMASRKGKEMPVPLNGGGFGVAEIAEVEQAKAAATTQPSAPQLYNISVTDPNRPSDQPAASVSAETDPAPSATAGEAGQLAPAIDTGYREVIPVNQPQAEVSNEPVTPVPASGSEGQGYQPGAGEPAAAGAGPDITGLSDRAGSRDPADYAAAPPVPDGQQQNDQTLTAPAPDAGVAVSAVVQPDPVAPEPAAAPASNVRMSQQQEGLSVDEASKVVDDFLKDYNGNIPVEPFIREKANEIYGPAIDEQGLGDKTKGAYHPGKSIVTVVSRNARDGVSSDRGRNRERSLSEDQGRVGRGEGGRSGAKADLITTLRHELLGHYGTDTFTPENKQRLLQKLIDAKNEKWIAPVWKQIAGDSVYGKKSDLHQAEEVFAHIAEKELPPRTIQAWNDIKTEFARLLRKAGLAKGPIKEHELDSLIKAVGKGIRNGERTKQNIRGDHEVIGKQADEPAKDDKPERIISFSKQAMAQGDKPAKHLTRKEAELVTKEWFKQYRGASGIDVQIHATQAELEKALGLVAKDGLIRRAAFDDDTGTLHVAADTISNPKRMREILRHEVLAHYGLANVLGDGEYTKLISRLIKSKKDPSMKAVWEWVDTHYADDDIGVQAEEVIAHLAEIEPSAWRRGWDTVAAWVTKALRMVGFAPDGITAAETRNLIEALGKKMKRGGPDDGGPDGGKKFSQEAEQPAKATGVKMSQTNTAAADAAMEKLNLGPKPDIIDKTKTNLDKLRNVERSVVKSWVDRFIKKANTEVLDALAPIKYAEDAAGITDAADSGYVAARMATGAASTMQATMLYGLPEWKDGVIQRKAGTGEKDALLGIFSDLGADLHNWLGWMAGHRAEMLMKQGRENLLSEQDIEALKGLGNGKEAKFNEAKARWNRLNAATLDLAQEAGLFTKEARSEFESEWYIPFFRESDDGDVLAPFKPKGIANQNAGIKKLKGGEANTADLLENIFTSTSKLIDASMKNMAAQKTVWNLADTGIIEVVAKPNMMDWRALKNGKNLITVKIEGEDYMIKVEDPDLYRAMTFFDRQPFGTMVNMAAKAKRLLTAGVTASPEFMLRNFLRDSLSSWAISKDGFKPVIDSIKGVKKTLAMDGSTIDVMFSGASFLGGYVNGNDPGAMADTVRKSLRRKGMTPEQIARYEKSIIRNVAHAKGVVADVWEKYSRYGEALENANREAVYDAAIKAGKSHAQAAFESKDLMDFSMMGGARAIQAASLVLPFFNARIQGLGKLTRELRDNPREIAKRAGMITAMSLGLLAANWDDERYEELPDWDKDANWHFFVGDQHWRIPKPFEIGVMFGTIPERMVRAMGDKDTGAQFGKAVARAIGDTFALNPTPQIVKPMVEAAFNYDTFRGGPIDSPQDLAVQAEARYNEQTSLLMRKLGEVSGFSPKQLEHLVIGYTGTIGGYVMATADGLIRAASPGESASWRADEIPLVKSVYRGTGPAKSTQHMEQFYQMLNEVNQLKRTIDQYRSEGLTDKANELLDEQGGILKSRRSLSRTQQQVRVVRNKIELIQRDRTMNAEDKRRRIDELLARRNDLVYQAVNKNRVNWE
ncbi:LPD38 domain-containing protein [Aeromonas sp. SG16]|uniref:LPD38 domain-containing protein n=1 Tax=Aeromonas sp. SG16 TaxID=2950548 RepID=UPI0021098E47|nr:LPD38 domain-containing protein [Aeromonas sp. SG16]MCQ4052373.1 hypothetical protein [Aeromonas sp. SG16]